MENGGGGRNRQEPGGLTLGAILLNKQTEPNRVQNRTLLDLIRSDPACGKESKKSWKDFRDKLRLKLAGVTWTSTVSVNVNNRLALPRGEAPAEEREPERTAAEDVGDTAEEEPAARMSLMALLSDGGSSYLDEDEEEEEVAEVEVEATAVAGAGDGDGGGDAYNNCCVCMVRHKGSAFIPCGHTFCRLCSREVFAQRGNCPLCNNFILEILDIF